MASTVVGVVPWQTISAGRAPDIRAFLAQAGTSAARGVAARSLRRPGLALAVTTLFDLFVAYLGGAAMLATAIPRAASGLVAGLLSAAVGSRTGPLRTLSGILGLVTALVTLATAASPLLDAVGSGADPLTWAPAAVTFASMLFSTARTATTAFRRTP